MNEPVLDFSEVVDLYKEDARRSIERMHAAVARWEEVSKNGPANQELRTLAHQLRGSGRTFGFRSVTRLGKALERLMIKLQAKSLQPTERVHTVMVKYIDRLSEIFKA